MTKLQAGAISLNREPCPIEEILGGALTRLESVLQGRPVATHDAQYLRVFVHALRRKLEPEPSRPRYLLTETGVGYRLRT